MGKKGNEYMGDLSILEGYGEETIAAVEGLISRGGLEGYFENKYGDDHHIRSDKALFLYVQDLKKYYLKKAPPIHKIVFDDTIDRTYRALGLHSMVSRTQGRKLKSKNEIRIASLFKEAPADLLRMIVIHELAHVKEKEHNRDFYRLCTHMESDYHRLEFDLRLYLILLDIRKKKPVSD